MRGTFITTIVATIFILTEARSLLDNLGHTHDRHKRSKEVWVPSDGQTPEEWYRCHGMTCQKWEETKSKMAEFFRMDEDVMNLTSGQIRGAFDGISFNANDGSLDGCIWLTEEQAEDIISNMRRAQQAPESHHGGRRKRKLNDFSSSSYSKWKKFPIVYKFDGHHTNSEQKVIKSAFQSWMDQTCVTFKEASVNAIVTDNHLLVTRNNTGCHSFVGRVNIKPQQLNLQYNCLWEFGIPVHEIGHTLGLWHEQQRADRDPIIRVLWENIKHYRGQFAPVQTESLGVPYDVGSVMHYAPRDGTSNGRNTMETRDPLYQQTMGQKTGLSYLDAMIINRAYCQNVCTRPLPRRCENFGYQDPKDCSRCRCSPGFSGRYCEWLEASSGPARCGGTLYATTTPNYFTSPGYGRKSYENHQECNWMIKAQRGYKVEMRFTDDFSVYCHNQGQCYHWVEVRYTQQLGLPGPRFCCYKTPDAVMTSQTRDMLVVFRSNWTADYANSRKGFKAVYVAVPEYGVRADRGVPSTSTTTTTTTTTPRPTTTTTTTSKPGSGTHVWSCDFEGQSEHGSWCSLSQDANDDFDWTLTNQRTPSDKTGPQSSYDGQYYIFIETSNPRRRNDEAIILLPAFRGGEYCVHFSYHMYGFHIKTLQLLSNDYRGRRQVLWSKTGQQGNRWITERVSVNLQSRKKLGFVGIRGEEYSGDIALDSIHVISGRC